MHRGSAGSRDCWDGTRARRSAPEPGAWPAEPPCHRRLRNAESALTAARFGNPNPPNVAGTKASASRSRRRSASRLELALRPPRRSGRQPPVHLVAYHVQQRPREICLGRHLLQQPIVSAARAAGPVVVLRFAVCSSHGRSRMRPSSSRVAPLRAVGEHEAQLTMSRPSQPISPFAPAGFHRLHRSYEEIRLLHGHRPVVVASSGLPLARTVQTSLGKNTGCPAAARPHYRPGLGWILGVAFVDTLTRSVRLAGVHLRSVRRFASGFISTRPHGARGGVSRRRHLGSCLRLAVATNSPRRRTSTSNPVPMPGTPTRRPTPDAPRQSMETGIGKPSIGTETLLIVTVAAASPTNFARVLR